MKRTLTIIGLGVAGIVLAVALSVGAFALVGDPLSEPATTIQVPASPTPSPTEDRATPSADEPAIDTAGTPSSSASPSDDHGGNSGTGGGGGSGSGDDHGGSGGGHGSDD